MKTVENGYSINKSNEYQYLREIVIEYISDKSCKTPLQFFASKGLNSDDLLHARLMIFEKDLDLYNLFVSSWYKNNKKIRKKEQEKAKLKMSKVLYLIENVDDFDIVEFWKLIPFENSDDLLYEMLTFVKKNFKDKYDIFINFIADKGILSVKGLEKIDIDLIRKSFPFDEIGITYQENESILNFMENNKIPFVKKAYFDVLSSYVNNGVKISSIKPKAKRKELISWLQ